MENIAELKDLLFRPVQKDLVLLQSFWHVPINVMPLSCMISGKLDRTWWLPSTAALLRGTLTIIGEGERVSHSVFPAQIHSWSGNLKLQPPSINSTSVNSVL